MVDDFKIVTVKIVLEKIQMDIIVLKIVEKFEETSKKLRFQGYNHFCKKSSIQWSYVRSS